MQSVYMLSVLGAAPVSCLYFAASICPRSPRSPPGLGLGDSDPVLAVTMVTAYRPTMMCMPTLLTVLPKWLSTSCTSQYCSDVHGVTCGASPAETIRLSALAVDR